MKITLISPCYNVSQYIPKLLNSLAKQSYKNFELLIVNDGSTDDLFSVVSPYLKKYSHWKYYEKENGHWGSVINYVLQNNLINGDIVTIIDPDDWFTDDTLENVYLEFIKDPQLDFLVANFYKVLSNGKVKGVWKSFPHKSKYLDVANAMTRHCIPLCKFVKVELFKKVPWLKEKIIFWDAFLYIFFSSHARKIYFLDQPLGYYLVNRDNSITNNMYGLERIKKTWSDLKEVTEKANEISKENPGAAAHLIWSIFCSRKKFRQAEKNKIVIEPIKINPHNFKVNWMPWNFRLLHPKFYIKFSTRKWWTEK